MTYFFNLLLFGLQCVQQLYYLFFYFLSKGLWIVSACLWIILASERDEGWRRSTVVFTGEVQSWFCQDAVWEKRGAPSPLSDGGLQRRLLSSSLLNKIYFALHWNLSRCFGELVVVLSINYGKISDMFFLCIIIFCIYFLCPRYRGR